MKTIIVPTDFSPIAENAMRFGLDMALNIEASLMLVHVYQVPVSVNEVPMAIVSVEDMRKASEEKLASLKQDLERISAGRIKIYTEARLGTVADELDELCHVIQPFAVVMGTQGANRIERILFGSNTLHAIRHLSVPVLVIPPGASFRPVHKIGLACDFRDVVPTTPDKEIKTVVQEFKAELHVLNVDHDNRHFAPDTPMQSSLLNTMLEGLNPQYHFIDKENIDEGLNEFAEKNDLDFLIVIPKKHNALDGLFHKSHTKEMAFHSHVPVMAIHEE
jgi:nucleotide-binding universal stress UspA family protein